MPSTLSRAVYRTLTAFGAPPRGAFAAIVAWMSASHEVVTLLRVLQGDRLPTWEPTRR